MGGYHEFETSLKLDGQKVVLVLTIQMSALVLCSVKKIVILGTAGSSLDNWFVSAGNISILQGILSRG